MDQWAAAPCVLCTFKDRWGGPPTNRGEFVAEYEWKIAKPSQACTLCSGSFKPGHGYFSALFEKEKTFERRDYCAECFKTHRPENVYSYWLTHVADEDDDEPKRPVLDAESVLEFFRRLGSDQDPQRRAFRFVLALMLTRKKVLKLGGSSRNATGEELLVFVERRGGERHEVSALQMDEQSLTSAGEQLGRLLGLTPAETAPQAPEDAEASPVSQPKEQTGS